MTLKQKLRANLGSNLPLCVEVFNAVNGRKVRPNDYGHWTIWEGQIPEFSAIELVGEPTNLQEATFECWLQGQNVYFQAFTNPGEGWTPIAGNLYVATLLKGTCKSKFSLSKECFDLFF